MLLISLRRLTRNQKAIAVSICMLVTMCIIRSYHFSVSGFITSDEGLYLFAGLLSAERNTIVTAYANRIPYQIILGFFGWILNLDNVYRIFYFAVGFDLFCSVISVFLSYKIIDTFLPKHAKHCYIYILAIPTLIMFDVATVAVLTESMSYLFLLFGVYSLFRAIRDKSVLFAMLSGASLGFIYFTREPYLLIAGGGLFVAFGLAWKKFLNKKQLILFSFLVLLFFRIPASSGPVNLTNYLAIEVMELFIGDVQDPFFVKDVSSTNFIPSPNSSVLAWEQKITEMYVSSQYKGAMTSWTNLFPSPYKAGYTTYSALVGMAIGWNPLVFALSFFGLTLMLKRSYEKTIYEKLLLVISLLSILVLAGSIYVSGFPSADQLSAGIRLPYGTMVRLSHSSIFATFLVLPTLKYIEPLFFRKRLLSVIILAGIMVPVTFVVAVNSFQNQWSSGYVDRVNFSYRSPYLRAYDYFQASGKTLVFGGVNIVQLSLFCRSMDTVFIARPPANETDMNFLVNEEKWDTILIYGITHYTAGPALEENFPFFWSLLQNETAYGYSIVWKDGESYLLKVTEWVAV